ncbi:MAG: hypothetical protein RLN72_10680 [Henriciella sp.]
MIFEGSRRIGAGLAAGLLLCACSPNDAPADEADAGTAISVALSDTAALALACTGCHSAVGGGIVSLNGYTAEAILTPLKNYKLETNGTTVMHRLVRGYSDEELEAVSAYLGKSGGSE